jgi:pyruvate/2-oxoglutarate dehydrogenase complex dihydrolipoamide dehydrogenase (E3) component
VLEAAEPLAREDPECAAIVLDQLAREGITLRNGVSIAGVAEAQSQIQVVLGAGGEGEETIAGSHLLIAAGRRPNVEGLGLEAAGIRHDPPWDCRQSQTAHL